MIHSLTLFCKVDDKTCKEIIEKNMYYNKKLRPNCWITDKKLFLEYTYTCNSKQYFSSISINNKYSLVYVKLEPMKFVSGYNKSELFNLNSELSYEKIFNKFSTCMKLFHKDLPPMNEWKVSRIDYCYNITTPYVKEYIKLFQRANIPSGFKMLYNTKQKRHCHLEGSFYLKSQSGKNVNINFYDKQDQLIKKRDKQHIKTNELTLIDNATVTQSDIKKAKDILRLEIQCLKGKSNNLKNVFNFDYKEFCNYIDEHISKKMILDYYKKTIGYGNYFTLSEAIKMVNSMDIRQDKANNLINLLSLVNKHRNVNTARSEYGNKEKFNRYLLDLHQAGINPVTIPRGWGIDYLENPFFMLNN